MSCGKSQPLPYELVSFMELLQFEADAYCRLMSMIGQIMAHFQLDATAPPYAGMSISGHVYAELGAALGEMELQIRKLELPLAMAHFQRMKTAFHTNEQRGDMLRSDSLARNLAELTTRIIDELQQRLFLNVPVHQAPLYVQSEPPFGAAVDKRFPQMSEDVSEAGKCLALNRNTAAVFHLMRIMEIGLQRFGDKLGVTLTNEKVWQVILDGVNKNIKSRDHKRPETKKFAEIASHLYNVKVAWRNEVMHPKQTYTDEEATAIFRNVRTFVSDLTGII